ncbi:hypothetical protein L1887_51457 [Cichorium endivia]|nr:hypothetical protein L1887_51457 [Cichorium endivia]
MKARVREDQHLGAEHSAVLPPHPLLPILPSSTRGFVVMLISLIGPPGSGKASVAHYLATRHGFEVLCTDNGTCDSLTALGLSATSCGDEKAMLDFVTDRWHERFVTLDLTTVSDMEAFIKRPFFLCVEVGAPLLTRWKRYQTKHKSLPLEKFVALDDEIAFGMSTAQASTRQPLVRSGSSAMGGNGIVDNLASVSISSPSAGLAALRRYVHVSIINDFPDRDSLNSHLSSLNLPSEERLRPCWDSYFLKLCNLASLRSNCMKRRVGAVLVSSNRIISTGYNGTPSGLLNCNQGGCARCNNTLEKGASGCGQNLDECLCLHAEENALLEAGRQKISSGQEGKGATMYCNTCPCLRCAVKIIQSGIRTVVYQLEYSMDARTKAIFAQAGVDIRQFHLDT